MLTCQLRQSKKYKVAVVTELKWQERNQWKGRKILKEESSSPPLCYQLSMEMGWNGMGAQTQILEAKIDCRENDELLRGKDWWKLDGSYKERALQETWLQTVSQLLFPQNVCSGNIMMGTSLGAQNVLPLKTSCSKSGFTGKLPQGNNTAIFIRYRENT